jgi:mono/diheme cytochrome c family protein
MPSFALSNQQASQLVDYFAGWSRSQSRKLEGLLEPIHLYRDRRAARKGALETRIAELKNQQALARAAMSQARDLLKAASPASGDPAAAISRQDAEIQRLQKLIDRTLAEYEGVNGFDNEWFNVPLRQPGELPPALEGFQPRLTVATEAFRRFCYQWKLVNPGALDPLGGAMPPVFDLSKPEGLKARDKWRSEQRKLWEDLFRQVEFLAEQLRTDYPFHSPREAPEVSPERFYRGQVLFEQMKCTQCHAQGDEAKLHALWMKQNPDLEAPMPAPAGAAASVEDEFGDDKPKAKAPLEPVPPAGPPYQAPNLHHIARRLQRKWVDHWLQQPNYFVPGITMPAQWPNGDSVWLTAEGDVKDAMHKRFGHTGPEQRELMLDYLYAAARRNYTPLEELLLGRQPMQTPLPDLAPPVVQGPARVALQLADLGGGAEQQVDFKALSEPEKLEYLMDKGKEIYSQLCINCHQATGMGVAGQFPPLNGSEWVLGEHTRRAQLIVLHGAQGPITVKGQKWTPPQPMPAGGGRPLTNEQIAAVLTYVRNNWDNKAPAIYPDEVAATRKKYPRNVPWTEAELLQIVNEPQTVQQPVEPPKPSDAPKPAEPAKP